MVDRLRFFASIQVHLFTVNLTGRSELADFLSLFDRKRIEPLY